MRGSSIERVCRKARGNRWLSRGLVLGLLGLLLAPQSALAWWSHDWSYRKQITIDASAKGADLKADLGTVPVLIRLHEGVFKFSDANNDGSDLRFIAEDDKTPLKYHVEKFDSVFNLAFVWVQLPQLKAGSTNHIWMYYGNANAASGADSRETYDPDQVLVYHFAERGTPAADASGYANNARTIATVSENSLIGVGVKFDAQSALVVPASASMSMQAGDALTWSAWIKPAAADAGGVLFARHDGARSLSIGLTQGVPYVAVSDDSGAARRTASTQALGTPGWHQIAVIANRQQLMLYVDGKPGPSIDGPLPSLGGDASIGADVAAAGAPPQSGFAGEMDELEISKIARDGSYLQLAAQNQGTNDRLVGFGGDERLSSWSSGYVGIILKSVTLDGWVIIFILLVMAFISWVVMISKIGKVQRVADGNKSFLKLYRAVGGDFSALNHLVAGSAVASDIELAEHERELVQQAPLFHLFSAGVDELRQRLKGEGIEASKSAYLSAQSIEAIRASLDASLVEEDLALNGRMVLLTIAISGGPFIGLLGTVIGVMITFAAIAASGDVNINSIAPGIAAALVATVAGLVVAIPALFGYNYLITRIQAITAQMQVFVDTCITRMAEIYNAPRELRSMAAEEV